MVQIVDSVDMVVIGSDGTTYITAIRRLEAVTDVIVGAHAVLVIKVENVRKERVPAD